MASEGKAVWETGETAESDSGIHILDGNVRMIAVKDACYRLPAFYGEEKKLEFSKAYRIEEYGFKQIFKIIKNKFRYYAHDLSYELYLLGGGKD